MKYITKSILKLPERKKTAKKGDHGRVLIIGGSTDFAGAPILAAMAAKSVLRSGADIATLAAPARVAWAANCICPDIITRKFKGNYFMPKHAKDIVTLARRFDVIAIGCGIGTKKQTIAFIKKVTKDLSKKGKFMVIDADAIKAIRLQDMKNSIITPHSAELRLLMKNSGISPENLQRKTGSNVIIMKGYVDKIISKERIAYNRTGNAFMTKGGTGDVLAGLCAGFLAQTRDIFKSACMAAYLNGSIGDRLHKKKGRTFIASDMVEMMDEVFR